MAGQPRAHAGVRIRDGTEAGLDLDPAAQQEVAELDDPRLALVGRDPVRELPPYRSPALPLYRLTALPPYRPTALPHGGL